MPAPIEITRPVLPLALALPDPSRAAPQWISSPQKWGERAPFASDELGDWIWAPAALCAEPFELVCEFDIPLDRGVVGAYATGAVRGDETVAVVAINGVIGTAGGALDTRGADYRGFEGELSPWLHAGTNSIAVKVRIAGANAANRAAIGCALRLLVRFADGGEMTIYSDENWRARAWDGVEVVGNRMVEMLPHPVALRDAAPVEVVATRAEAPAFSRPRLYASEWPAPLLRRDFAIESAPRRALLTVCGLGCYEAYLNGKRVGDHVLDPAQTAYDRRAFSVVYDVTDHLQDGANVVGIWLGHGWFGQNVAWIPHPVTYGQPAALVQLEIESADGVRVIVSDADWRVADGPIRADNLYRGEIYDARRERADWNVAAGATTDWQNAVVVAPLTPRVEAQTIAPMRRQREVRAVQISEPKPKLWVVDLGENIVGWAKLRVRAPRGTRVRLRFAEALNADGTLNFHSTGPFATRVVQQDEYVCKGGALETWEPRFTYHGFQYVEVSGLNQAPTLETITGVVVHTDLPEIGDWRSSDAMLNAIEKVSRNSLVGNLHGIITDCPHRERCQWQADAEIIADYALYRFEAAPLFAKCLDDSADTLDGAGLPREINVGRRTPPLIDIGWSTLAVQAAWRIRLFTGDLQSARAHYDLMRFICDHYHDSHPEGIVPTAGHGDHAAPPFAHDGEPLPECPRDAYATTLLFESTQTLSQISAHLSQDAEAERYRQAAAHVRNALLENFYDANSGGYAHPTLDAYALLLGLYPDGARARLVAHFGAALERHHWMNVGGFFGYRRIVEAAVCYLEEADALRVLTQAEHPGIAYTIKRGATSIYEQFYPDWHPDFRIRSLNHYAYGAVCENFWRHLAGIAPDASAPGFARVILAPRLTNVIGWVAATHEAPVGQIRSAWRRDQSGFSWQIALPRGAQGRARVPLPQQGAQLAVNGEPYQSVAGVSLAGESASAIELDLAAGCYQLRVE